MQVISADETEMCARFEDGGSVELYEAGTKRFETTTTGVSIAGTTISIGGDFISYDNGHLKLGTNSDLDLFHSGKLESSFNLFQIFSFQKFLNKFKI